jgi:hypothetical protein
MNFNEKTAITYIAAMFHFRDSISRTPDYVPGDRLFISNNLGSFTNFLINQKSFFSTHQILLFRIFLFLDWDICSFSEFSTTQVSNFKRKRNYCFSSG